MILNGMVGLMNGKKIVLKLEGNGPTDERAAMIVVLEANFDLKFKISNLNYPSTDVHVASNSLLGSL